MKKRTALLILTVFVISALYFAQGTVNAQDSIPLVVAPSRQTVAIDPGDSQTLQIKFFNQSSLPMAGNLKAVNFYVAGKDGAPILLEDSPNNYIKLPYEKAVIPAGDVLKVDFKVTIPKSTKAGGSYAAIIFETTGQLQNDQLSSNSKNETLSAVSPRIVGLVSIRINGQVFESAFADVFKLPKFLEFGPIPVYFEILNKGGYHITPNGQVRLTNWMGKVVDQKIIEEKNIFPEAKRSYEEKLGTTWMFGKYKVDLAMAYGEAGKVVTAQSYIWVIPVTVIIITIFAVLIAILLGYIINKNIKARQEQLEEKLEQEINELEALKNKFKDKLPK